MRRTDLENGPQLAQQILQRLLERMELPVQQIASHDRAYFLAQVVKGHRREG